MALGAFLAGMVVGRSDYSLRAASDALPMRDAFAVLFFVSVGMLLDPASLLDSPWLFAGTLAIVLVDQPARRRSCSCGRSRQPFKTALTVAVALAQIGEFSFILSTLGRELGLFTHEATNTIVAASIVSIVRQPDALSARSSRSSRGWRGRPRLCGCSIDRASSTASAAARSARAARTRAPRGADRLRPDRHARWRACSRRTASSRP